MPEQTTTAGMTWLMFSLLTVVSWGVYGVFLHNGRMAMGDPENGLYKAFLFVGIAYFLTAVLAPLALLMFKGAAFSGYTAQGAWWSLIAGVVGAVGAFGVLLAFGVGGRPAAVMSIIFAGAPVVNAVTSLLLHPPAGGWSAVRWQFYLGIALAALGGCLVTYFKPGGPPTKTKHPVPAVSSPNPDAPHPAAH